MDESIDTTPARLRPTKRKSSRLNIEHGSSDYQNDSNGSFSSVKLTNHSNLDSPGGLHHRHPHRANLSSDGNGGSFSFQRGRAAPQAPLLPNPPSNSKLNALKNKSLSSSKSLKWIVVPSLMIIYFMSIYAHQHYFQEESSRGEKEGFHQTERLKEMKHDKASKDSLSRDKKVVSRDNKVERLQPTLHNDKPNHTPSAFSRRGQDVRDPNHSSQRDNNKHVSSNFAFDPKQQTRYEQPTESIQAHKRAQQWAQTHLDNAIEATKTRRAQRVKMTSGPNNNLSNLDMERIGAVKTRSGVMPVWYELNHLTKETMVSLHQRWNEGDSSSNSASDANDYSDADFQLCGLHANEAARHHPQNYYPSDSTTAFNSHHAPLGPNSRVLITGILSPIGMHLAIALSRQCNVTNFLGIDTQIPNDPLSRLEQEERLAVLMEELNDLKLLQVPFLGVEGKQLGKKSSRQERESRAREEALMNIFLNGSSDELMEEYTNLPTEYKLPNDKFGIPSSPGIHPSGFGPLEILLEYRPTHVVHLAGTQSDSFLSTKSANYVYPFASQDEDEVILKESISSKPHLYEMRMASTGMEQLLSAVVAQSMIPPRYGRDADNNSEDNKGPKEISTSDLNKMKIPHFVYASSYDAQYFRDLSSRVNEKAEVRAAKVDEDGTVGRKGDEGNEDLGSPLSPQSLLQRSPRGLKGVSSLIDEVLASTYYALHGVSSVALRFDAIYGPRGFGVPSTSVPIYNVRRIRRGGVGSDVDLAETAVRRLYRKWMEIIKKEKVSNGENDAAEKKPADAAAVSLSLIEEAGWSHAAHDPRDFVYVEDAIGAIIAAMQYRAVGDSPSTFGIGSGEMSHLSILAEEIEQLSSNGEDSNGKHSAAKSVIDVEQSNAARSASLDSKTYLQWSSTTSLQDGAAHLLAWHLDRALSFFPPSTSTDGPQPMDGEDVLSRRGIVACSDRDNPACLREAHTYLPCSSECATKTCSPSVFDSVLDLSREVTEDCDAVLYTVSLGYNVKKLNMQTQYSDGEEQRKNGDPSLCTIAFVPTESRLVEHVIAKIPPGSLSKMHLDLSEDSDYETKLKKLSGHLVHQGWLLIFVDGATSALSAEDIFLPKLSPRRLFHPSVRRAMFVDENFSSTPLPEDALFLTSEMSRGKIKKRTVIGPNEKGKKIKYKLPEEPPRTAVLMVAPARDLPKEDLHHMPLKEVMKILVKEMGGKENDPEPKGVRIQREFYDKARSLINSFDLRSLDNIARHRIQIKDFIRSRWVVHDLREEEGHQLRCEWYREHVRWNTHFDQLSFAYVMAKRELTRKVITEQPLQTEVEKTTLLQMVIDAKSDAKEWHPIFSGEGTTLPIHFSQIAPEAIPQNLEDQHEITEEAPDAATDVGNTFYVRIMSDPRMMEARKVWARSRKEARKRREKGIS